MNFLATYRFSFYAMLTCATLVMSIDATDDNPLSRFYPIVVGVASVIALTTVDRDPKLAISQTTGNILALGTIGLAIAEYEYDENLMLLALGHWLVYLQLVKTFLAKSVEDDWFLFLLGLMQVLVGAVMSQSDAVGLALLCWVVLSIWVLRLFSLRRDAERGKTPVGVSILPSFDQTEPYPGLIDTAFLFASLRIAATTLALGGVIFLAMPRRVVMGSAKQSAMPTKHLTGFDDEVQLGQLGEILENDSVVMSVECFDENNVKIAPSDDVLWRGVTLTSYDRGHWTRPKFSMGGSFSVDVFRRNAKQKRKTIRQQIKLEPSDNRVLFALRPMLDASAKNRLAPDIVQADGTLVRAIDARLGGLDYEVLSANDGDMVQPGEQFPNPWRMQSYSGRGSEDTRVPAMPEALRARLAGIASPLVASIPETDWIGRAKALETYLRDSGQFSYSLVMNDVDRKLDPVVDFLENRKAGHCEYFASSLTLLCRSINIPARMVNGFKGGDWNDLASMMIVRQKHAHSWVEVLSPPNTKINENGEQIPIWVTLDPTPFTARKESVARVGGFAGNFRELGDFIRYVWVFYIVGYNSERQNLMIYGPARRLAEEAMRGFRMIGQFLMDLKNWLFRFPDFQSFFSLRGAAATFVLLAMLSFFFVFLRRLFRIFYRLIHGHHHDDPAYAIGVAFYRRLAQLLVEFGIERPAAETPQEFAKRASILLAGGGAGGALKTADVAEVPGLVVDAFYKIRFGNIELTQDMLDKVEAALESLERSLKPTKA